MPWTGPVLPALPSISYPRKRSPTWSAVKNDALSGKRARTTLFTYPTYSYELPLNYLRTDPGVAEWQGLMGFINALAGAVGLFGYDDPDDNAVTAQAFGEGDGTTLGPFQLVRALGNFVEPVFLLNGAPQIFVDGVASANWTVDLYGRVTFTAGNAPASGTELTWTGAYYWPCRFDEDSIEMEKFLATIWQCKSLKFSTEKLP